MVRAEDALSSAVLGPAFVSTYGLSILYSLGEEANSWVPELQPIPLSRSPPQCHPQGSKHNPEQGLATCYPPGPSIPVSPRCEHSGLSVG